LCIKHVVTDLPRFGGGERGLAKAGGQRKKKARLACGLSKPDGPLNREKRVIPVLRDVVALLFG
jgi:hypothetical protein